MLQCCTPHAAGAGSAPVAEPHLVRKRYHVFYQRIIDAVPQRWGHVVSSNLVDWEQPPLALQIGDPGNSPRTDAGGIPSGSYIPTLMGRLVVNTPDITL